MTKPESVLIIGSGPIVIGQAAEFDYAGTQACKAMREEGVRSILVNSNPATIMTDEGVADVTYIEPLTVEVLRRVIERERPAGLLPTLGGQVGLNLAVELHDAGILDEFNVRLLGTPLDAIRRAEDRQLFRQAMRDIGEPVPPSAVVTTLEQAREALVEIGLPLAIRPAYTLGGTGGGFVRDIDEFERVVKSGLAASPITQVLVERSLQGWKEVEYEVMRDAADTCITICNMENIDPMGVHTGDSIVVAPSQTLSDKDYQLLRTASLNIIRSLGIEGGCNVQLALAPRPDVVPWLDEVEPDPSLSPHDAPLPYYVIEVNPRVSRSSALASKATGYPIARVAAKIAAGKRLDEIANQVTGRTQAAFEPALDYVVVKIPRWPFDKFSAGDRVLSTQMKATGEVMAIDRTFEAALQKAVRSLEVGSRSVLWEDRDAEADPVAAAAIPTDNRLWHVLQAIRSGASLTELAERSAIDPWFLDRFQALIDMEQRLLSEPLAPALMRAAKRMGFADEQIANLAGSVTERIREQRHAWGILPVYKMVDTCAAEFDAVTPYFYSTYEDENEATPEPGKRALVIGSGPIRIGQGIEFDYASVKAAQALHAAGWSAIMANSNPETVSTDFDTSDRLYFEPLDEESVRDIIENEEIEDGPQDEVATILQFGGQTAINLAGPLTSAAHPILGSAAEAIDLAEDRRRFERFLADLGIPQPPGTGVNSVDEAILAADTIGYPVLVRPSYVLGGRAMEIVQGSGDLARFVTQAQEAAPGKPVLIDKYLAGIEVEVDAICSGDEVLIPGIMEHIERAGVHSGDSMAIYPAPNLFPGEVGAIIEYTRQIGVSLGVRGLMNIQYVVMRNGAGRDGDVFVIEVNPRASRTVPFLSKVTGVPMVEVAVRAMLGEGLREQGYPSGLWPSPPLVAVKAPVFSMSKLGGVDTHLGPEMKSTGEVMGVDVDYDRALTKALVAAGMSLPECGSALLSIADKDKAQAIPLIRDLGDAGYQLHATAGTASLIRGLGYPVQEQPKRELGGDPDVIDLIRAGRVDFVINTPEQTSVTIRDGFHIRRAATEQRIPCFTSIDTAVHAVRATVARQHDYNVAPLPAYISGQV